MPKTIALPLFISSSVVHMFLLFLTIHQSDGNLFTIKVRVCFKKHSVLKECFIIVKKHQCSVQLLPVGLGAVKMAGVGVNNSWGHSLL